MRAPNLLVAVCCAVLPAVSLAGGLGVGTIDGSYEAGATRVPVKGYIAVVDATDGVTPVATEPDLAHCHPDAPLRRETTLAWQRHTSTLLAINAGFWWMPHRGGVPECQLPPYPYKANDFDRSLPAMGGHAPAVLALKSEAKPEIGYANQVDIARFDVVISGDWIRGMDGHTVHRGLLLDNGHPNPSTDLAPRTAVGVQRDTGRLVLLVIEGQRPDAAGLSLLGLAKVMRACGVSDAINLDGGGSATFSYTPALEPSAVRSVKRIALSDVCRADALERDGLSLAIDQRPLEHPLRSRAPGGKETSASEADRAYRRVLTNLGFRFDARFAGEPRGAPDGQPAQRGMTGPAR